MDYSVELWKVIASLLMLFFCGAGIGAGAYLARKVWRYITGKDEQAEYLRQRKCEHVWILTCRLCGLRKDDE